MANGWAFSVGSVWEMSKTLTARQPMIRLCPAASGFPAFFASSSVIFRVDGARMWMAFTPPWPSRTW